MPPVLKFLLISLQRTLTWKLINTAANIRYPIVRRVMYDTFAKWSKVANINFQEVTGDKADIMIKFVRSSHADPYPFDGRGGTLAHAFYPFPGLGRFLF